MSRRSRKNYRARYYRLVKSNLAQQQRAVQNKQQQAPTHHHEEKEESNEFVHNDAFVQQSLEKIRMWAITYNIIQRALSELLKILPTFGVTWLPSDARTVMRTPQNINIVELANGKLWYNGIKSNIQWIFSCISENLELELNFNIDGIPLHNSSKKEFWPILTNIHSKCIYLKTIQWSLVLLYVYGMVRVSRNHRAIICLHL